MIGDVEIGEESSIWYSTVIRGDVMPIRIGARTSIQDGAVVHALRSPRVCVPVRTAGCSGQLSQAPSGRGGDEAPCRRQPPTVHRCLLPWELS